MHVEMPSSQPTGILSHFSEEGSEATMSAKLVCHSDVPSRDSLLTGASDPSAV